MEVVTGAMSTLLPTLADLLKEEYDLHKNTRGEIRFLKAELESMETALLKVSEAPLDQPPDLQVKLWAREVRKLSYEIEDNIDKFLVRLERRAQKKPHSFMGFIHKSIDLMTKAKVRHKIGTEIKDIRRRIKEVTERRDRYKVDSVVAKPAGPTIDSLRLSALYKEATELIGTEDKANDLVKRLTEGDVASKQQLKIVSIVGFGGLGKTTLANVVYQKLKSQFDCGAFVSLSLNPNMKNILRDMLHQLEKHNYSGMNESIWGEAQLVRELRDFLLNKRYFIVIDDIWNSSVWKTIKHALIDNKCGSRVITTTRILDIAKQVGGVYVLKPLSLAHSRNLFYQRIFGSEDKCPPNKLAEVSDNIIKRCGGVPLAIITTASMLASKNVNDWFKVYQAMGSGLQDSPDVKDMRRILSVSYYDLPPHLKTCLLSISLYPEDYKIVARDLIWQWIGEGFVREEHGKSLYEVVGEDYFCELINKSLIQPADITDDKARACRVHDMVLDLITSLSREENFLTSVGGQQSVSAPSKIRRLSVHNLNEDNVKQLATMNLSHLRSFSVFDRYISLLPALSSFSVLRALHLSNCSNVGNHHVKVICNMFHLRYLWLRKTFITHIPDEIGNLQFLQVLDISGTYIKVLPASIVQLTQLVYLHIGIWTSLPEGLGNLRSLQELLGINITSPSMLHDLSKLKELRNLRIRVYEWKDSYKELFRCLSSLVNLKTIKISGVLRDIDFGVDNLSPEPQQLQCIHLTDSINCNVPRWISSLSNLSTLLIQYLETLREEHLQVLGSMPSLRDLDVWVVKTTHRRRRMVIDSSYPFRCLTKLKIGVMELEFAQGSMQKLQTVEVILSVQQTLDRFGDLNFGLENASSLKQVYVGRWYPGRWWSKAEDSIRKALDMNPNKPTIEFGMATIPIHPSS